jgi:hypothetical protein
MTAFARAAALLFASLTLMHWKFWKRRRRSYTYTPVPHFAPPRYTTAELWLTKDGPEHRAASALLAYDALLQRGEKADRRAWMKVSIPLAAQLRMYSRVQRVPPQTGGQEFTGVADD